MASLMETDVNSSMNTSSIHLPAILGCISDNSDKNEVLLEMASHLEALGKVKTSYGGAVIEREKSFPTGIPVEPIAVAIPHSDRVHVISSAILVAKVKKEVFFNRIDDPEETIGVKVIFMLAMADNQGQLDTMSKIMELIQDPVLVQKIIEAENAKEIEAIVVQAI